MEKIQGRRSRATAKRSSTPSRNSLVRSTGNRQKKIQDQTVFGLSDKSTEAGKAFVLCIRNEGADDLELRKLYQVLPDESATKDGFIRVIDESGEDYLYPESFFAEIDLPKHIERALSLAM